MTASVFTKTYERFRKLLIRYRKNAGLTQQALAEKLEKPQSFVSKYESGERRLDVIELLEIAHALHFEVGEFLEKLKHKEQ